MMTSGKLATWLATARPGHCPCGAVLKRRKRGAPDARVLCSKRSCREKYEELYQADRRGPTYLRAVKRRESVPDKPKQVRLVLECDHVVDLVRSLAKRVGARRRCAACEGLSGASAGPPGAEADA